MKHGVALILSAPSGTGKSTICKRLRELVPHLRISISHTTRKPRPGEQDGVDYHFIDEAGFLKKIDDGDFLEWAKVHDQYYGTALSTINQTRKFGHPILLELDVQGVETLRKIRFDGAYIMILPPSIEELANRLRNRSTEPEEKILRRISTGRSEVTHYRIYDYVITNRDVEDSAQAIVSILKAEETRSSRYIPTSKDIADLLNNL